MLLLYYFLKMKDVTKRIQQCDYNNKLDPITYSKLKLIHHWL